MFRAHHYIPLLLLVFHREKHPPFFHKEFVFHLGLVVITSGVAYHILFFMALQFTTPTNTALIIGLNPFFTAFAEVFILKIKRQMRFYRSDVGEFFPGNGFQHTGNRRDSLFICFLIMVSLYYYRQDDQTEGLGCALDKQL